MSFSFYIIIACCYTAFFGLIGMIYICCGFTSFNLVPAQCMSLLSKIWSTSESTINLLLPIPIYNFIEKWTIHVLYRRNHYIQIFYMLLILCGYMAYSQTAFLYVYKTVWGMIPFLLLIINLTFFAASCFKDPGVITDGNHKGFIGEFSYDEELYHQKTLCRTCKFNKPARSKHCAICNQCVARFDHHCSWMNNCIGRLNYKYFIGFLVSLTTICFYTSFLIAMVFGHIIYRHKLHLIKFQDGDGNINDSNTQSILNYLAGEYPIMTFLLVFLVLSGLMIFSFTIFHVYLIITNKTTNELFKLRALQKASPQGKSNRFYSNGIISNVMEVFCK